MTIVSLQLPRDFPVLEAHFAALSQEDLRLRFCYGVTPYGVGLYLDTLRRARPPILGVFAGERRLIAVAHLVAEGRDLEVGLSVHAGHRNQGLAGSLLRHASVYAQERGFEQLLIHCLAENLPMLSLARRIGMTIERSHAEIDGRLRLRAAADFAGVSPRRRAS